MHTAQHTAQPPQPPHSAGKTPGGVNAQLVLVVGVVSVLLVFVIYAAVDAWYRKMSQTQMANFTYTQTDAALRLYLQQQNQQLHSTYWIDQDAGVAGIPIDRAMDLYLQQRLQSQPR